MTDPTPSLPEEVPEPLSKQVAFAMIPSPPSQLPPNHESRCTQMMFPNDTNFVGFNKTEDWSTMWAGMTLTTELMEVVFKFKTKIDSF